MPAILHPPESLQAAQERLEILRATAEARVIERAMESQSSLAESYGWNRIDDFPDGDRHHDHNGSRRRPIYRTTLDDREDGKCRPLYETEYDLGVIRAQARTLAAFDSVAIGAKESLLNYTLGTGVVVEVVCRERPTIAAAIQRALDRSLDAAEFRGDLDQEIHNRTVDDGEAFVALSLRGGVVDFQLLEPDQITEPANASALDAELGTLDSFDASWSFGVHTERRRPDRPLGYYAIYDSAGREWEYLEAARMEHFKRNVPRSAKRGVSHFQPVAEDIEDESKLKRSIAKGAAVQSAIAFIREHVAGATKSGVEAMIAAGASGSYARQSDGGSSTRRYERFAPGTIKDIPSGMKYHAGPLGQSSAPTYIDVAQFMLRSIGVRWNMPEYMISADASNANFSSTLVAESPFVKARENDQEFFVRRFESLLWKVLRLLIDGEVLVFDMPWSAIREQVDIKVVLPDVASRDRLANSQVNQIEHQAGILSLRTWAGESGREYDEERENIATEPVPVDPTISMFGGQAQASEPAATKEEDPEPVDKKPIDPAGTALNGAQIASLMAVVSAVTDGTMPMETARQTLTAAFPTMGVEKIDAILSPITVKPATAAGEIAKAMESLWEGYP